MWSFSTSRRGIQFHKDSSYVDGTYCRDESVFAAFYLHLYPHLCSLLTVSFLSGL